MGTESVARDQVDAAVRASLPFFGIACVVLVFGISSLLLAMVRSRHRLLLWLGSFSVLYALRLFGENELVHAAIHVSRQASAVWHLCLTYAIPIPFALFARELFGKGWKNTIAVWLWAEIAFAIVAVPAALFANQGYWADTINGYLIIGGTVLILLHLFLIREGQDFFTKSLRWPVLVFGTLVVLTNRGFRLGALDIEPIGFVILLAGLGWTAARRALATERKLIDVEQELTAARRIQSSIIPLSAPDLPGLRLAALYQPMTSVAGDFYDFLQTGDHCLTILVADVSGHGVPAALVSSMLKVCFAAQREEASSPAAVLAGLNKMLRGSLGGQYVTAACAAINLESQLVTYAGAGHPPTLLLRTAAGEIVPLSENGLFIGPFPQAIYTNISVPFESGDRLLIYTDGIVEACGPDGQEFGRERLERFLLNGGNHEPAALLDRLLQTIATDPQQDDLTVVLAHFE